MKNLIKLGIYLLFFVYSIAGYAGVSTYNSARIQISKYGVGGISLPAQVIVLQDDQYHYMHNNPSPTYPKGRYPFRNQSISDFVSLEFTGAATEKYNQFSVTVGYEVDAVDSNGHNTPGSPFRGTLTLQYNPVSHTSETYTDENQFMNGDSIIVKITSITTTGTVPADVELTSRIVVDRWWPFEYTTPIVSTYNTSNTNNTLNLAWNYMPGAESYDLEWLFVSAYAVQPTATSPPDFTQATRINTTEQNYSINLAYDAGTVYWRVRGVGNMTHGMNEVIDGAWSNMGSMAVGDIDAQRNWTYSAAYAEQGKRKEVLSYFDGSTRQRQAITENNSSNVALISETMYDYEGRSAITTLAAPDNTDDSKLGFYSDLNLNLAGMPYSRQDFDVEQTGLCGPPPGYNGMSVTQGSANYYSDKNPLLQYGLNAAIPDAGTPSTYTTAGSFPFTQTKYDLEGRVAEQAGPGTTLNEGSGHTTKYFYATPLEANIYKLFGSVESGDPSHYQEKAVEDPNGQISISYIDMSGKVVATSIIGPGPTNMVNVTEPTAQNQQYTSLLTTPSNNTFNAADNAMEINQDYFNTNTSGSLYTNFSYILDPGQLITTCLPKTFQVLYDLDIRITDPCGNIVTLTPVGALPSNVTESSGIITGYQIPVGASATVTFKALLDEVGVYHITKKLSVDPEGLAEALKCYDDSLSAACSFTTLAQYQTNYMSSVNRNNSCLSCDSLCIVQANVEYPNGPQSSINTYTASCAQTMKCDQPETISQCAGLLGTLENDMSPGGQYFDNIPAANPQPPLPIDGWLLANVGPNAAGLYAWANTPANGCSPTGLTATSSWDEVRANWQPCFANYMVTKHPEYCRYLACQALSSSEQFDGTISQHKTIAWATSNPVSGSGAYINLSGAPVWTNLVTQDPFFTGVGSSYLLQMEAAMTTPSYFNFTGGDLWAYAAQAAQAAQTAAANANPPITTAPLCDLTWQAFVGAYLTLKNTYYEQLEATSPYCIGFCDQGVLGVSTPAPAPILAPPAPNDIATTTVSGNGCNTPNDAVGFYIRDPDYQVAFNTYGNTYLNDYNNNNTPPPVTLANACCNTAATVTFAGGGALMDCGYLPQNCSTDPNTGQPLISAYLHLWVDDHALNQTIDLTGGGVLVPNWPVSINTVWSILANAVNNNNTGYSAVVNPPNANNPASFTLSAPCWEGAQANQCNNSVISGGLTSIANGGVTITVDMECSPGASNPANQQIYAVGVFCNGIDGSCPPTNYASPNCLCTELTQLHNLYIADVANNTINQQSESFEQFAVFNLNTAYGLTGSTSQNTPVTTDDIDAWGSICQASNGTSPTSIPGQSGMSGLTGFNPPQVPAALNCNPQPTCAEDAYTIASNNATVAYNQEVTQFNNNFIASYNAAAFSSPYKEIMTIQDNTWETHYTLYYYDLAGNLTRTVPPAGVVVLSTGDVASIEAGGTVTTNHTKKTFYQYNTLNELVGETTPDAGFTSHSYDNVGRLRFTQNAKQAAASPQTYSYTKYDQQGRVVEVGESRQLVYYYTGSFPIPYLLGANDETFPAAVNTDQVTKTYYDGLYPGTTPGDALQNYFDGGGQQNLRSRVATTTYELVGTASAGNFDYATHYSYDVHGNVSNIIQDNPGLGGFQINQRYKKTRYVYDLVSGNVNMVAYQPGQLDRFLHKYEYDADNRLTNAYTSTDSIIWDEDAKYFYYLHGPLARVEIGQDKVQAMDYAYTINGWLKGINSNVLKASTDIGQDGIASSYLPNQLNVNKNIGEDAYGFTLNYFTNDYTPVNSAETFYTNSLKNIITEDLFNGNIKQMAVALTKTSNTAMTMLDNHYKYDQLNRINTALPYEATGTSYSAEATTALQDYKSTYAYDPDGNITGLTRNGVTSFGVNSLDNLTYNYPANVTTATNNLLGYVQNAGALPNMGNLPAGQTTGNYKYDAIGELISDAGADAKISAIQWSVYGKVLSVTHNGGTEPNLQFLYDPQGNRICEIVKPQSGGVQQGQLNWTYTYYTRDASGNIMAIYKMSTQPYYGMPGDNEQQTLTLVETPIYGSKRIGDYNRSVLLGGFDFDFVGYGQNGLILSQGSETQITVPAAVTGQRNLGYKSYELTDHLGDVLMTVSDRKLPLAIPANTLTNYSADVISATDYYPFGEVMPGRNYPGSANGYRFGYNGKEQDPLLKGIDNSYDYGMRMLDPRLGRFMSVDPLTRKYAYYSPFQFSGNTPIRAIDRDGMEIFYHNGAETPAAVELSNPQAGDVFVAQNNEFQYVYNNDDPETGEGDWIPYYSLDEFVFQQPELKSSLNVNNNQPIDGGPIKLSYDLGYEGGKKVNAIMNAERGIEEEATIGFGDLAGLILDAGQNRTIVIPIIGQVMKDQCAEMDYSILQASFNGGYHSLISTVAHQNNMRDYQDKQIVGFYMTDDEFQKFSEDGSINTNDLTFGSQGYTKQFPDNPPQQNGTKATRLVIISEEKISGNKIEKSNSASLPIPDDSNKESTEDGAH